MERVGESYGERVCAAKTVAIWRFFGTVLFVIALLALGYFLFQSLSVTRYSNISVSGVGRTSVAPDKATLTVGVQTESGESVADAAAQNAQRVQRVLAAIGNNEQRQIESIGYETYPIEQRDNDGNVVATRFRVTNRVQITLLVAQVIDAATNSGATEVSSLSFALQDTTRRLAERSARTKAVRNAREKADTLARAASQTVGDVVRIEEPNNGASSPPFALQRQISLESSGETPIRSPARIDVDSEINVVYTLHPES